MSASRRSVTGDYQVVWTACKRFLVDPDGSSSRQRILPRYENRYGGSFIREDKALVIYWVDWATWSTHGELASLGHRRCRVSDTTESYAC